MQPGIYAKDSGGLKALFSGSKEGVYVTRILGEHVLHPEWLHYAREKERRKAFFQSWEVLDSLQKNRRFWEIQVQTTVPKRE